jgi:hypothetical protein
MSELADPFASPTPETEFNELIENMTAAQPKPKVLRQGLPVEYRMRHDEHYVEALVARPTADSSASAGSAQPVPVSMQSALRDLCQEFDGLASCLNLLDRTARPLRERLGLSLARIGVQRSLRYAQQLRVVLEDPRSLRRDLHLDEEVRRTFSDLQEELRLIEATPVIDVSPSLVVRADPSLLQIAIRACAGATIAMLELGGQPAELQVLAFRADDIVRCEFRQHSYTMEGEPPRAISVALSAARRIAQAHGGGLDMQPMNTTGSVLAISFS